jgi:hypothetical protein
LKISSGGNGGSIHLEKDSSINFKSTIFNDSNSNIGGAIYAMKSNALYFS